MNASEEDSATQASDTTDEDGDSEDKVLTESDSSDEPDEATGLQTALGVLVRYLDGKAEE